MDIQRRIFGGMRGQPGPFLVMVLAYAAFAGMITALSDVTILSMAGSGWTGYAALLKGLLVALATGSIMLLALRRDTHEQAEMQRELYLAHHDPSTNLFRRPEWIRRVDSLLGGSGAQQSAVVLTVMVNRYNYLVHRFGFEHVNQILSVFGRRLRVLVKAGDMVGSVSPGVFVVYMPAAGSRKQAMDIVERILENGKRTFQVQDESLSLDLNIGLCAYPDDGANAEDLLARADIAMQQAVTEGLNGARWYTEEMAEKVITRVTLEKDLERALERQELQVHFQPRVLLGSEGLSGFEALLRWQHPRRGLVPPAVFIEVAEDSGLIVEIGKLVLAQSMAFLREWLDAGLSELSVSVNVSNAQLSRDDFAAEIRNALATSGIPARLLELEVTETAAMSDPQLTMQLLQQLKQMGVRVALDDFGTGYSSLSYLQRFPIDCLKIDRSFVTGLIDSRNSQELIKTVITLGHALGARVLAEGVETRAQARMLADYGCDEAQGYLYGRAVHGTQLIRQVKDARHDVHLDTIPAFLRMPRPRPVAKRAAHVGA